MEFNFLIGKIMGNNTMGEAVQKGLTAVAAAAVLSVSPASAEATAQHKINKVTCTTKASCEQLSLSIDSIKQQIKDLDKKIKEETNPKRKFFLQQDLTKLRKEKGNIVIAVENNKQAEENQKQAQENIEQSEIKKTNIKIAQLRGVLLDK